MATKKTTIAAEIKVDTGGAEKEVSDLKDNIEGVGEATAVSITELKKLKNELKTAAVGSEEFKKLKQAIDDTEEAINAAKIGAGNFADIVGNLPGPIGEIGGQVSNLTGGLKQFSQVSFADIKGSFKDLFDDIKDIGANIAKTTGLTKVYEVANKAASKSLQFFGVSAQGATAASKAFGLAISGLLAATGLILLTATIQAVSEAWEFYSTSAERAEEAQKNLNETLLKGSQVALDAESKSIKRSGELLLAQAKARGASADEIYKIEQSNRKLLLQSQERYYNELKNKDSDEARASISAIKDTKNEILIAELNFIDQRNKLIKEKEKAAREKQEAEQKQEEEKRKQNILDKQKWDLQMKESQIQADIEDKAYGDQLIEEAEKADAERAEKAQKAKEEDAKKSMELALFVYNANKKLKEQEKADDEALTQAKYNNANQIINILGNLNEAAGASSAIGKGLALAQIGIDTAQAISALVKNSEQNPLNSLTFGSAGLTQFLAGMVRITANIANAKRLLSSKVASVPSPVMPSMPRPSIPNVGMNAPLSPTMATTTLNQAQVNQIGNVAARAYVVESDISGNQERVIRLNRAARIS